MTYILAWKHQGACYVCADSAVTTTHLDPLQTSEETTFGQQVINAPNRQVIESGLKVLNLGSAVVSYSGDVSVGSRVVLALRDELIHNHDLASAVNEAISDAVSLDEASRIKLVAATPLGGNAEGVFFNADGKGQLETMVDDYVLRLGSMPPAFRQLSSEGVKKVAITVDTPSQQLACVLALLQSIGVNNNLIDHGVGGAFTGAYVTGSSIHWQEDMLYSVVEPGNYWAGAVETAVRDNALVVKSQIAGKVNIVVNRMTGTALDTWWNKWHAYVNEQIGLGKYGYVAFLTKGLPNATVVEMNGNRASKHLILPTEGIEADGVWRTEITMSRELAAAIKAEPTRTEDGNAQTSLKLFGYAPPPEVAPNAVPIS